MCLRAVPSDMTMLLGARMRQGGMDTWTWSAGQQQRRNKLDLTSTESENINAMSGVFEAIAEDSMDR